MEVGFDRIVSFLVRDSRFTTAVLHREFLCQFVQDFDGHIDFIYVRGVHAHTVVGCLRLYADASCSFESGAACTSSDRRPLCRSGLRGRQGMRPSVSKSESGDGFLCGDPGGVLREWCESGRPSFGRIRDRNGRSPTVGFRASLSDSGSCSCRQFTRNE